MSTDVNNLEYSTIKPYYESHKNVCDYLLKSYVKSFSFPENNALISSHVIQKCGIYLSFQRLLFSNPHKKKMYRYLINIVRGRSSG